MLRQTTAFIFMLETQAAVRLKHNIVQRLVLFTVKLVYKGHPCDQQNMVFIHRWYLYTGGL